MCVTWLSLLKDVLAFCGTFLAITSPFWIAIIADVMCRD